MLEPIASASVVAPGEHFGALTSLFSVGSHPHIHPHTPTSAHTHIRTSTHPVKKSRANGNVLDGREHAHALLHHALQRGRLFTPPACLDMFVQFVYFLGPFNHDRLLPICTTKSNLSLQGDGGGSGGDYHGSDDNGSAGDDGSGHGDDGGDSDCSGDGEVHYEGLVMMVMESVVEREFEVGNTQLISRHPVCLSLIACPQLRHFGLPEHRLPSREDHQGGHPTQRRNCGRPGLPLPPVRDDEDVHETIWIRCRPHTHFFYALHSPPTSPTPPLGMRLTLGAEMWWRD